MIITIFNRLFSFTLLFFTTCSLKIFSKADSPFDWEPSVSISDNLDEPQDFGFCIDFFGAGSSLNCDLHARSCKSNGGDTQFEYHVPTKAVRSVNYNFNCDLDSTPSTRGCVIADALENESPLTVGQCNTEDEKQVFDLVESGDNYELHIGEDLCLSVGDTSRRPAPNAPPLAMARDLFVSTCSSLPGEQKTWTIKPRPTNGTETNETVTNVTDTNVTEINETQTNETETNETQTNETQTNETETNETETNETETNETQSNAPTATPVATNNPILLLLSIFFRNLLQFIFSFNWLP